MYSGLECADCVTTTVRLSVCPTPTANLINLMVFLALHCCLES